MAKININTQLVLEENNKLPTFRGRVETISSGTATLRNSLVSSVQDRDNIGTRLKNVCNRLSEIDTGLQKLYNSVNTFVDKYAALDELLGKKGPDAVAPSKNSNADAFAPPTNNSDEKHTRLTFDEMIKIWKYFVSYDQNDKSADELKQDLAQLEALIAAIMNLDIESWGLLSDEYRNKNGLISPSAEVKEILAQLEERRKQIKRQTDRQSKIDGVLVTAKAIADDDSHGYSQSNRLGNPDYDCSSFIIDVWTKNGVSVKENGAHTTSDMKKAFLKSGFIEFPINSVMTNGKPDPSKLQIGDILLREGSHVEMVYSLDPLKMIAAHTDRDGKSGDSDGTEICVGNYWDFKPTIVLRYSA
jgi:hypothetical protein